MSAYAPWNFSVTAYTSVRLHVLSTATSRTLSRAASPTTALPIASGASVTRSSKASGPLRWFTPMTRIDMRHPPYALAPRPTFAEMLWSWCTL